MNYVYVVNYKVYGAGFSEEFEAKTDKEALKRAKEICRHANRGDLYNHTDKYNPYPVAELVKGCVWEYCK